MHSKRILILEIILFLTLVAGHHSKGFQRKPSSSLTAHEQTHFITSRFQEQELARIFLTNSGVIPRDLRSDLNETGVLHFLAISAGQLLPVIKGMEYLASSGALLGRATLFAPLMRFRAAAALCIGVYLSLMYGLTGSLMRLLFIEFCHRYVCESFMRICCKRMPRQQERSSISKGFRAIAAAAKEPGLFLLICLGVTALIGRNLMTDWSFLYASIGALSCVLGLKTARVLCPMLAAHRTWVKGLLAMVLIQLFATLAMLPLTAVSMGPALLTNVIVAPIVGLLVVPATVLLSLIIQFGLANCAALAPVVGALIHVADLGLVCFRATAQFFAALDSQNRLPLLKPFSDSAYLYTVSVIGLCWFGPRLWNILLTPFRRPKQGQLNPSNERSWVSVMMGTPNS